jgi:hypothetical protein
MLAVLQCDDDDPGGEAVVVADRTGGRQPDGLARSWLLRRRRNRQPTIKLAYAAAFKPLRLLL